jgi:hypothetical protein
VYEFTTSIEISDLLLAVLGLIGCIGAYVGIFFISEIDHNRKYREGLR